MESMMRCWLYCTALNFVLVPVEPLRAQKAGLALTI
jgi:hypothetical protein